MKTGQIVLLPLARVRQPKAPAAEVDGSMLWARALNYFMAAGLSEERARSFLGVKMKEFGKGHVEAAIAEMLAARPIEPLAYLSRVLTNSNRTASWRDTGRNDYEETRRSPNRLLEAIEIVDL